MLSIGNGTMPMAASQMTPQQKVAQAMQYARGMFPQNPMTNMGFAAAQAYRQRQMPNPMQRPAAPSMDFNPLTAGQ